MEFFVGLVSSPSLTLILAKTSEQKPFVLLPNLYSTSCFASFRTASPAIKCADTVWSVRIVAKFPRLQTYTSEASLSLT